MRLFKALFGTNHTPDTQERLEDMEIKFRRLQEEWTEVYGKFRTLQMRVARQLERQNESSKEEPQGAGGDEAATSAGGVSSLSPRLQKIQEHILERRRRGGSITPERGE